MSATHPHPTSGLATTSGDRREPSVHDYTDCPEVGPSGGKLRAVPEPGWIRTDQAVGRLSTSVSGFNTSGARKVLRYKVQFGGQRDDLRGAAIVWNEHDVKRLAHIRRTCRLGLAAACRVMVAMRANRI